MVTCPPWEWVIVGSSPTSQTVYFYWLSDMAELADALDLGSSDYIHMGSSPIILIFNTYFICAYYKHKVLGL